MRLSDRQMDVLLVLAAHPGQVVDKETIVDTAWEGMAVADSSIAQAIHGLRETLLEPYLAFVDGRAALEML